MHTAAFLRCLFPLRDADDPRGNDLIRIAVVHQAERFPGTIHWKTRAELHTLAETGIASLGVQTAGNDVFFTAHGFTEARRDAKKEQSVDLLDVAWVELDDADIPPDTFNPLPSIVVSTSPGRYHLYWLLDQPYPAADVERLNYRLAYGHNLREDKGGWALTKWLRLPGSISYKRTEPFEVQVASADDSLIYTLDDFADLPDAPEILHIADAMPEPPNSDNLPTRDEIANRYSLPKELFELLDRQKKDRSAALWRMYHLCYHAGLSRDECFALVRGTVNDKFHAEYRYNAEADLWKDIYRAFRMAHTPSETPVLSKIRELRAQKMPATDKRRQIAQLIAQDLCRDGAIYFDEGRSEALYYNGRHIIPMDPKNRTWKALLNLRYWVVDGEDEFTPVNSNLYAIATEQGSRVTPRTMSFWDRTSHLLYVYNGEGKMYRLDGEKIEFVDNGTDGVLFRDLGISESFIAKQPDMNVAPNRGAPTLDTAIFGLPNYEEATNRHSRPQAMTMMRMWLYSLFFGEELDARPHLIITGPTDSGKSLAFQAMSELLSGAGTTVSSIPTDLATFQTLVSNAHHTFLDNVDTPNKWLEDALCEVATGIQFTRKILYTTNDHITYQVKCNIGLTTRNTWFSRADVANRSIVLHVERRELKTSPTILLDRIRQWRSELWWMLLRDLNKIVVELKTYTPGQHRLRMAAYADFVLAACRALDISSDGLLELIEGNQRESALDNSILWQCLDQWVRRTEISPADGLPKQKNNGQWVTANRLHTELRATAMAMGANKEYERKVTSAMSLGHQLKELIPDIKRFFEVGFRKTSPANLYQFTVKEVPDAT